MSVSVEKRDFAYEAKLVVPLQMAELLTQWSRQYLAPDPHGEGPSRDGYQVHSLYFDTPNLDVYRRTGWYSRAKYRVRRYGAVNYLFFERKLKQAGFVAKRRTILDESHLSLLAQPGELNADWPAFWFSKRLQARQLQPRCAIFYDRIARLGANENGAIRMTIDTNLEGRLLSEMMLPARQNCASILPGMAIVEMKYQKTFPTLFNELLEQFKLTPVKASKYRMAIEGLGVMPQREEGDPAGELAATAN